MYVVSYDIASDRLRNKVAKEMENYGKRIQYSVFECRLTRKQFCEMYEKLSRLTLDMKEGNIRFYELCENCEKKVRMIGQPSGPEAQAEEEVIVI